MSIPITEQSNDITKNIDIATSEEIVNLFSQTDKQLFNYNYYKSNKTDSLALYEDAILANITQISSIIQANSSKNFKIIFSGCGTSGRLGYICAKSINEYLGDKELCDYIIAGDDFALINSIEAIEDSPSCGYESLKERVKNVESFLFIGITCGLSAPFVAGQLDYCFHLNKQQQQQNFHPKVAGIVLIGFNPVELARKNEFSLLNYDTEANDRKSTFYQLLQDNKETKNFFILNPLIGPEPITGSSRMKSGSATKILIDLIFLKYILNEIDLKFLLNQYEGLLDNVVYNKTNNNLASLIDKASKCLKNGHSISYASIKSLNTTVKANLKMQLGILACVDASECIPTFGANREDIRGFIEYNDNDDGNYWNEIKKFPETSTKSNEFNRALNNITNNFILAITQAPFETKLENSDKLFNLEPIYKNYFNYINQSKSNNLSLYQNEYFLNSLLFLTIKLCLNAISTGSYVKYGKIYENYMIDVKASNFKLYKRAMHIIDLLSSQYAANRTNNNENDTETCLLKAIYSTNDLNSLIDVNLNDIPSHILKAKDQEFIVPKALIMKITKCSFQDAYNELKNCSTVRNCIENIIKTKAEHF